MPALRPAGNDPIMRQILEHGWKRVVVIIGLLYILVYLPICFAWRDGNFINNIDREFIAALDDNGYYNQFFFLLPFFVWFAHYYFKPLEKIFTTLRDRGVVKIESDDEYNGFIIDANSYFKHPVVTFMPYVVMISIVFFAFKYYWFSGTKTWYSPYGGDRLTITSIVAIIPVVLLYYVIPAFIFRVGAVYYVVRRFLKSEVNIQPFHPDESGGLSPLGNFSLRITSAGVIIGCGILIGLYVNLFQYGYAVISAPNVLMLLSYIVGLAVLFFVPLFAANKGMSEAKQSKLQVISDKFNIAMNDAMSMNDGVISQENVDTIERLNRLYTIAKNMPVYPFNAGNMIKFLSSVMWPVGLIILQSLIDMLPKK